ncbi:actin-related protein 2/3 complex subunit 5 [Agrilus planipennis]|uniref:Actin-related protein 2/3 complex subunit 5 n=1 Tax=Agrilus planipennis TaxID=224129 RepID=A0A1W4WYI6_AGRPL|nr:actin-related protein 2/3 complex subunit 5 [Agrilus planipennis]
MAKNTFSSAFRKIDVDQYNEDNFKEDDGELGGTGPNENDVMVLLNQGKYIDALKAVINSSPLGSKNQHLKDQALNITLKVLLCIRVPQIEEAVQALTSDELDILMKYVYRGFENPTEGSSGHLLHWHEKIYGIGGVGCIIRVLSDTKRA